jgi:hypothetical protein
MNTTCRYLQAMVMAVSFCLGGYAVAADSPGESAAGMNSSGTSGTAPASAKKGGVQRYPVVGGGLFVEIRGYPSGYAPNWALTNTPQSIVVTSFNHAVTRGAEKAASMQVRLSEDGGRPVLEFSIPSVPGCLADLAGLPQVITQTPKRFELTNLRFSGSRGPQCSRAISSTPLVQGWISLSANEVGDLFMDVNVKKLRGLGDPHFDYTARGLRFANQFTPLMAAEDAALSAEANKQAQERAVAADAQRKAAEAEIERSESALRDLPPARR